MILIKADHNRRIAIPGVSAPVRRPVDINQELTGFTKLRTLRIYRFDQGSVIEGHAEEDEVILVVLAGAVELTIIVPPFGGPPKSATLSVPNTLESTACAAYLPPRSAYKLVAPGNSAVAYARARPVSTRLPKVFFSLAHADASEISVLLEEYGHAERLRFRLVQFDAHQRDVVFAPMHGSDATCESLVYVESSAPKLRAMATSPGGDSKPLESSDTVAVRSGEHLTVNMEEGSLGLALIVMAT